MLKVSAFVPTKDLQDEREKVISFSERGGSWEVYSSGIGVWAYGAAEKLTPLITALYKANGTVDIERMGDSDGKAEKEIKEKAHKASV